MNAIKQGIDMVTTINSQITLPKWDLTTTTKLPDEVIPWLEKMDFSQSTFEADKKRIVEVVEKLASHHQLPYKMARYIDQIAGGMFTSKYTFTNGTRTRELNAFIIDSLSKKVPFFQAAFSGSFNESQKRVLNIEASDGAFEALMDYLASKNLTRVLNSEEPSDLKEVASLLDFYGIGAKDKQLIGLMDEFDKAVEQKDLAAIQRCFDAFCKLKPNGVKFSVKQLNQLKIEYFHISAKEFHPILLHWISTLQDECKENGPLEITLQLESVHDYPYDSWGRQATPLFRKSLVNLEKFLQIIGPLVTTLDIQEFWSNSGSMYDRGEEARKSMSQWGRYFKNVKKLYTCDLPKMCGFVLAGNPSLEYLKMNNPNPDDIDQILAQNPQVTIKASYRGRTPKEALQRVQSKYFGRLEF